LANVALVKASNVAIIKAANIASAEKGYRHHSFGVN
jgi:hypothetical protein